jgi:hypothetical protein
MLRISRNLTPWNIHNVNLELMPILDISQPKDLWWLNALVSLQMSDRELAVRQATLADPYMVSSDHVLVSVKDSLHSVLIGFTGLQGPPRRVFSIMDPKNGGGFMILFVQSLRLDLAAFTLVADVAVVPLENAIMPYIGRGLQALHTEEIMQIVASPAEVVAWKRLLPAFVERCRTWSHGQNCEYTSEGRVPRSTKIDENPICSCGRSVGLPPSHFLGSPPRHGGSCGHTQLAQPSRPSTPCRTSSLWRARPGTCSRANSHRLLSPLRSTPAGRHAHLAQVPESWFVPGARRSRIARLRVPRRRVSSSPCRVTLH